MNYQSKWLRLIPLCFVLLVPWQANAQDSLDKQYTLTLALMPSSGKQRQAYKQLIERFSRVYPQVKVGTLVYENEYYKKNIEDIIKNNDGKGDLFFWFGGERLRGLAKNNLILDISSWWQQANWQNTFSPAAQRASQHQQYYYALPINYYQWGFYYRQSMIRYQPNTFDSWQQFLSSCQRLAKQGQHLVTIGSKEAWPVAAWFDYLNLRINGLAFHQQLLAGDIAYTDKRVEQIFTYWQQAIDAQCFVPNSDSMGWKQALPAMYREKAAAILMGNFFLAAVPDRVRNDLAFAAFPPVIEGQKQYEEAPVDVIVAHPQAQSNIAAFWFLDFLSKDDVLNELNQQLGKINPLPNSKTSEDRFIQAGTQLLNSASGVSQFFDRDSPKQFASPAMDIMVEFLEQRMSIEEAMAQLEALRLKVFAIAQ
ncbi:extracellular solute-binding protein [Agarivorans aestuarii]|uniref:Extracellular solute-binding protein n=1 Tax=Agarivorans aestuarii TaxID=1563703 RepID=A0ABU7G4T1_9ALTE|nr:extracellular solute-binding protein [Agarivorans aestuarii]MEE1674413.1 extracellular solute-binding protein [Agarivorans aestuarii]